MSSIDYLRRKTAAEAWENEKRLVEEGQGTRDWTAEEQEELLNADYRKGVQDYKGHHMKSVSEDPTEAGNPENIQFLSMKEHQKAHEGNFQNKTNGYYDPNTEEITSFKSEDFNNEVASAPIVELSDPIMKEQGETEADDLCSIKNTDTAITATENNAIEELSSINSKDQEPTTSTESQNNSELITENHRSGLGF